jgi:hypothetical protein
MEAAKERSRGDGGLLVVVVARSTLRDRIPGQRPIVRAGPFGARPKQLGCQPLNRTLFGGSTLPDLPAGGSFDRLQASPEPYRLDPPGGRSGVDAHRHDGCLHLIRCGHARRGPVPGRGCRDKQLHVGSCRWTTRDLRVPAVPQREPTFWEVASAGVALRSGDPMVDRPCRARPRAAAELRGGCRTRSGCTNPG